MVVDGNFSWILYVYKAITCYIAKVTVVGNSCLNCVAGIYSIRQQNSNENGFFNY